MATIRNISPDALLIARGRALSLLVEPDETCEIPDDEVDAYCWRYEGTDLFDGEPDEDGTKYRRVPSDLWVEVPTASPVVEKPAVEEQA